MFPYKEYYQGEIQEKDQAIHTLLSQWLDHYQPLHNIPKSLKQLAKKKGIELNPSRYIELKQWVIFIRKDTSITNETCGEDYFPYRSYLCEKNISMLHHNFEIDPLIKYKLLLKFMDLIHKLFPENKTENISEIIRACLAAILNPNEREKYNFITQNSIFQVQQNIHGDLYIEKNTKEIPQQDFFYTLNNQESIARISQNNLQQHVSIYQYPDGLFGALLEYCYKYNIFPVEINQLKNIQSHIPNASVGDNDYSYMFRRNLEERDFPLPYYIYPGTRSDTCYQTKISKNGVSIINKNKDDSDIILMEITPNEIGPFLKALIYLPGRSIAVMDNYLEIFQEEYNKKYSNP